MPRQEGKGPAQPGRLAIRTTLEYAEIFNPPLGERSIPQRRRRGSRKPFGRECIPSIYNIFGVNVGVAVPVVSFHFAAIDRVSEKLCNNAQECVNGFGGDGADASNHKFTFRYAARTIARSFLGVRQSNPLCLF